MEALWKRSRCQDGMLGTAGGLMEGIAGHNGLTVTKSVRLSGWRVRPPAAAVIAIVFDGAEPIFVRGSALISYPSGNAWIANTGRSTGQTRPNERLPEQETWD